MAKGGVSALVLLQLLLLLLLCLSQCHVQVAASRHRDLLGSNTMVVIKGSLKLRDSGSNTTLSESLLAAAKRSIARATQVEKDVQARIARTVNVDAIDAQTPVASAIGGGEYVMTIGLGTPTKKFVVIADTGSDLNWVQCTPCTSCYNGVNPPFNPSTSTTYKLTTCTDILCKALPQKSCSASNTCKYSYSYGGGSNTQGDLAYETMTLGNTIIPHVGFGCGHNNKQEGGSSEPWDGLVGLGQGPLALPSQLSPSIPKVFSNCLVPRGSSKTSSIMFGNSALNANVKYTPLVVNSNAPFAPYYYVGVTGITIGGRAVSYPASALQIDSNGRGGIILDSGTTLTILTQSVLNPILAVVRQQVKYPKSSYVPPGWALCYNTACVQTSSLTFPSMVIKMTNNVDYLVPPENMFVPIDNRGIYCLSMASSNSISIIGNIQQQNILMVHDLVNKRVGFQAKQCDTM